MNENVDPIASIRSLAHLNRNAESELKSTLEALEKQLNDACKRIEVSASSKDCTLSECPPNAQWTRGHFGFGSEGIHVFYQSNDDVEDQLYDLEPLGPTYHGISIKDCQASWLQTLLENGCLDDLLSKIAESISDQTELLRLRHDGVHALASTPLLAVSSSFEQAARGLGYSRAEEDWKKAQSAIAVDPEHAVTMACSLIETVARHILGDLGTALPRDKSIEPLFKTAAKALRLAPEDQVNADLKGLCTAIGTIAEQIGALRTHIGDAHGKSADFVGASTIETRFAVNVAGSAATFLMERWLAKKNGEK